MARVRKCDNKGQMHMQIGLRKRQDKRWGFRFGCFAWHGRAGQGMEFGFVWYSIVASLW